MIVVDRPAPLLTVQDGGRFGHLASGVTRSGALDRLALAVGNALVGNAPGAAALEGCLGGAQFRCESDCTFALTGATVTATLNAATVKSYVAQSARAGDIVTIDSITRGAVWYFAVRGGIDVPLVLGSRSTLVSAGLGGVNGGPIKPGTKLAAGNERRREPILGKVPDELRAQLDDAPIALAPAPRSDALTASDWKAFYGASYTVSRAVSRVGYRLEGTPIPSRLAADLASEPACAGAMQLPPEGLPIVLMADFPTVGGYPIIGVVASSALGALAQRAPGTTVRFAPISADDAAALTNRLSDGLSQWIANA